MELFAKFKFNANADPFIDLASHTPNKEFERDTDAARLLRGQLSSYVAALSGSQFRVHVPIHHSDIQPLCPSHVLGS